MSPEIRAATRPSSRCSTRKENLIQMITVCAHCGETRSILFLRKDRWYCTKCRMEGIAPPNLYPVA